jgi:methanogenic corrinoid protein MtbC1
MVADAFEFDGWTVYYLGANTPLASLIAQVREVRPQLIGLSASLPYHLRTLREAIAVLRTVFVDDCPRIAVGGLVFNQFPELAKSIGAELLGGDACAAAAAAAPGCHAAAS